MASPFDVFRRHQKVGMVVLVFMAMFAFVVLDSFQKAGDLPVAVIAIALGLLLAGVFWFLGNQKGEGKQYAILGAIIGVAAGFIGPQLNRPEAAVLTSVGRMTHRDVQLAMARRQVANNFLDMAEQKMQEAYKKTHPKAEAFEMPRIDAYNYFGLFRRRSGFGQEFGRPVQEDVALASVFLSEADKMGIRVSDQAVSDYILKATNEKLARQDFEEILRRLGIDEATLYDAMKEEIKAKLAFEQLQPRTFPTPLDYWQIYRRMNVRQELEVAAIPASAFAKSVKDPDDRELIDFFNRYKAVPQTREVRPEPAFGTPRQVQLAWIKGDYRTVEDSIAAEVDKEIAAAQAKGQRTLIDKYYEDNKERLYRNRPIPEKKPTADNASEGPALKPPAFPDDDKKPGDKPPEDKPSEDKKPLSEKTDPEKSGGDSKPEPDKKPDEAKKPEGDAGDSKENSEPKKEKSDDGSCDKDEAKDAGETAKEAESKDTPKEAEKKEGADSKPADKKEDDPKAESKPADAKPADEKPEAKPAEAKPADATPAVVKPDDGVAVAEIPGEPLPTVEEPLPEFRPLDERLRDEIRQSIISERAEKQLSARLEFAIEEMMKLADLYNEPVDEKAGEKRKISQQGVSDKLKAWAKENGFTYTVSDLVGYEELLNPDDYPIGQSTETEGPPFQRRTVADMVFSTQNAPKYLPSLSVDTATGDRFSWWVIQDVEPHPSTIDQPGMKEKVLNAWKLQKARTPASERAKELAEKAKAGAKDKPLSEILGEETVTGDKDALQITVHTTPAFSWLRRSQAPGMNMFMERPPELSRIPFVTSAGDEFMSTVFNDLQEGEVGYAPNADLSVWYIVRPKNRVPSTAAGEEALRKAFLDARGEIMFPYSSYGQIVQQERQAVFQKWSDELMTKYSIDMSGLESNTRRRR